jgi:uncharacterized protein (TIGR00661 family)
MSANTVLFFVNGLGLGNSTRCHSVIQHLAEAGVRVEVLTSANGLSYFAGRSEVAAIHEAAAWEYVKSSTGQLSALQTVLSVRRLTGAYRASEHRLDQLVRERRIDLVVLDSNYVFRPMKRRGIPIVALNNADVVVKRFFAERKRPREIVLQFLLVEYMDYLFHRLVPDLVVSPRLHGARDVPSSRFVPVGPIVRSHFLNARPPRRLERICVMLSGSTFGTHVDPHEWNLPYPIDVVGRDGASSDRVRFHGKVRETFPLLNAAQIWVVNGGFSAVSEAYMMRRVTVVVPVERHAEQYLNGRALEAAGIGVVAPPHRIREGVQEAVTNYGRYREATEAIIREDGALEAAKIIRDRLG